jgi:hypothetical protein
MKTIDDPLALALRMSRWWSAPLRLTTSAAAALRSRATGEAARAKFWLRQAPVGIRNPA